jgi:hypothetical protein
VVLNYDRRPFARQPPRDGAAATGTAAPGDKRDPLWSSPRIGSLVDTPGTSVNDKQLEMFA